MKRCHFLISTVQRQRPLLRIPVSAETLLMWLPQPGAVAMDRQIFTWKLFMLPVNNYVRQQHWIVVVPIPVELADPEAIIQSRLFLPVFTASWTDFGMLNTGCPPLGFLAYRSSFPTTPSCRRAGPAPRPPASTSQQSVLAWPCCSGTTLCLRCAANDHTLILEVYGPKKTLSGQGWTCTTCRLRKDELSGPENGPLWFLPSAFNVSRNSSRNF